MRMRLMGLCRTAIVYLSGGTNRVYPMGSALAPNAFGGTAELMRGAPSPDLCKWILLHRVRRNLTFCFI